MRRPYAAMMYAALFAIPLLFGAVITYLAVYPSMVVLSPWLMPLIFPVYWALNRSSLRPAYVISKSKHDGLLIDEQLWWRSDYWKLPEATKLNRIITKRNGDAVMTSERIAWIDARDETHLKAFLPNEIPMVFDLIGLNPDDAKTEFVTSADIIGQESYNQSSYLFAKMQVNRDTLGRNMPWLIILGASFLAVFLGAGRIASMMGVQ